MENITAPATYAEALAAAEPVTFEQFDQLMRDNDGAATVHRYRHRRIHTLRYVTFPWLDWTPTTHFCAEHCNRNGYQTLSTVFFRTYDRRRGFQPTVIEFYRTGRIVYVTAA